ncbi:MAG: hypothetical protein LCH54_00735 [Bacteroidetes bacterium]|nr:hypothetical protein [Bacteroidota bacterium]
MSVLILFLQFLTLFPDGGNLGKPAGVLAVLQTDYASSSTAYNHLQKPYSIQNLTDLKVTGGVVYTISETTRMAAALTLFSNSKLGQETTSGLGDGVVSFSSGFSPVSVLHLAGTVALRVPIGSSGRLDNPIPAGWDEFQTTFLLSWTWYPFQYRPVFLLGEVGATLRENNKNHEMVAGAGLGFDQNNLKTRLWTRWKLPLGPINATDAPLTGSANGVSWGMLSGSVELPLPADFAMIYSGDWYFFLQNMGTPIVQRLAVTKRF